MPTSQEITYPTLKIQIIKETFKRVFGLLTSKKPEPISTSNLQIKTHVLMPFPCDYLHDDILFIGHSVDFYIILSIVVDEPAFRF